MKTVIFVVSLSFGLAIPAIAQQSSSDAWRRTYALIRNQAVQIDDQIWFAPKYDKKYDNSNHASPAGWRQENTQTVDLNVSWMNSQRLVPLKEEVDAWCRTLPDLKPGSYGYIDGAKVLKVLSDNSLLVHQVRLLDLELLARQQEADQRDIAKWKEQQRSYRATENRKRRHSNEQVLVGPTWESRVKASQQIYDTRYRQREMLKRTQQTIMNQAVLVRGVPTRGLLPGKSWEPRGIQLVIVGMEALAEAPQVQVPVAVPARLFDRGIDDQALRDYLIGRQLNPDELGQLFVQQLAGHADGVQVARQSLFEALGVVKTPGVGKAGQPARQVKLEATGKPWAAMTDDEKAKVRERQRQRLENMTPEQRKAHEQKAAERRARRKARNKMLTPQ